MEVDETELEEETHSPIQDSAISSAARLELDFVSQTETLTTLPGYSTRPGLNDPPSYRSPETLLSPIWLRQYLLLLATFSQLKATVLSVDLGPELFALNQSAPDRWGLFIEMAVRRFGIWQVKFIAAGVKSLPPLDVLMVWCSYLGSPRWYQEDIHLQAPYHPHELFPDFPLELVAEAIHFTDSALASYSPGSISETEWKTATGLLFSPIEAFKTSTQAVAKFDFICDAYNRISLTAWLTDEQKGFAQRSFEAKCHSCRMMVTKEAMAVRRLIKDLKKLFAEISSDLASYLLLGPQAASLRTHPLASMMQRLQGSSASIGVRWRWRRVHAVLDLASHQDDADHIFGQLMSAYVGAEKASVDLVPVTLRHSTFVAKLEERGWLEPSRWEERGETLDKAVARYMSFLLLAKESPKRLLVPTLGIDIAWQTHLLLASRYVHDTKVYVGHLLDREDTLEEGVVSAGFDDTAQRWQTRFKVLYSTSGHLPPDGPALTRLTQRFRLHAGPSPYANIDYSLPIIYGEEDSFLSHPSERNAVFLARDPRYLKARERRVAEFRDRLSRNLKKEGKGLVDTGLVRRAQAVRPAFVTDDHAEGWSEFGPTGYPVTAIGIIASGNVLDSRVIFSSSTPGCGVLGLTRGSTITDSRAFTWPVPA